MPFATHSSYYACIMVLPLSSSFVPRFFIHYHVGDNLRYAHYAWLQCEIYKTSLSSGTFPITFCTIEMLSNVFDILVVEN